MTMLSREERDYATRLAEVAPDYVRPLLRKLLSHADAADKVIEGLREALIDMKTQICICYCRANQTGDERQHLAICRDAQAALAAAGNIGKEK